MAKNISFTAEDDLIEKIESAAAAYSISKAELIRSIVREHFENFDERVAEEKEEIYRIAMEVAREVNGR